MKKQVLPLLFLVLGLAAGFLIMSCAPGPQNTNQAANANSAANMVRVTKPCTPSSVNTDVNAMIDNAGLGNQYKGVGNPNGIKNFDYRVVEMGTPVIKVLLIEGAISDGKPGNPDKNAEHMEKFIKEIDQLITKDCVQKAIFVKRGTFRSLDNNTLQLTDVAGFEWSTCEWPNVPCGDGTCSPSCGGAETLPTSNVPANGNTNSANTNANTANANTRANANRTP